MMKLNMKIEKPLIFFDVETTGVDVNSDRILELGAIKFFPDGSSEEFYLLLNPIVQIAKEATEKHGYTNENLKDKPTFKDSIEKVLEFFEESDLGGHNSNVFDIQILAEEIKRSGYTYDISKVKMIDTRKIYLKNNPKELSHLYTEYTGKTLENAHSANADIMATIEIFNKQVEKYNIKDIKEADLIGKTDKEGNLYLDLAGKFIRTPDKKYLYNFGKHKGEEVSIENVGFINWMLKTNFSSDTLYVAEVLLKHIMKQAEKV